MACNCCCPECEGDQCCGDGYQRTVGVCCEDVWRLPDEGVCCDGVWHPAEEAGVCCDNVWYPAEAEGECCGDVWRSEPGDCCGGEAWFPDGEEKCPEGSTFLQFSSNGECCGCFADEMYDPRVGENVPTSTVIDDLCCGCEGQGGIYLPYSTGQVLGGIFYPAGTFLGCLGRCCDAEANCTGVYQVACPEWSAWEGGCCELAGCPRPCCTELDCGTVQCFTVNSGECVPPSQVGETLSCSTSCLGECCVDGESIGQTTAGTCAEADGVWAGLGSTDCQGSGLCRDPYSPECCEVVQSQGAGLTFRQPFYKRTPPLSGTLRVTATGTTDSPIRIHGEPFGLEASPEKRCPFSHTFLICGDEFLVEPMPCESEFRFLDIEVCWAAESTPTETMKFSGCDDLILKLGQCERGCTTTLVYAGAGATSDSQIDMYGDVVIEANGSGPLVLTSGAQAATSLELCGQSVFQFCDRTLTLTGTSTAANEIQGIAGANITEVIKEGSGTWRITTYAQGWQDLVLNAGRLELEGPLQFAGQILANAGTLVVFGFVPDTGPGAFGTNLVALPQIGATLLLADGAVLNRSFEITAAGVGVIGTDGTGNSDIGFGCILSLQRNVNIWAKTGATMTLSCFWDDAVGGASVEFGSPGNGGVVALDSYLPATMSGVSVTNGTLRVVAAADYIDPSIPVTLGAATLEIAAGGTQTLNGLAVTAAASISGDLTVTDLSGGGEIELTGGTMTLTGTNTMAGATSVIGGTLVVTQIVGGPALVASATFTSAALTVDFLSPPSTGDQFVLLYGPTAQAYTPVLTNAGGASGTYDSSTSTLTIS